MPLHPPSFLPPYLPSPLSLQSDEAQKLHKKQAKDRASFLPTTSILDLHLEARKRNRCVSIGFKLPIDIHAYIYNVYVCRCVRGNKDIFRNAHVHEPGLVFTCIHVFNNICIHRYSDIHAYISTPIHSFTRTRMHTFIHTYMP